MIAVGQPKLQTINRLIQLVFFIPLVIVFARYYGIEGVGVAADLMLVVGVIGLLRAAKKFVTYSSFEMFFAPALGLLLGGSAAFAFQALFVMQNPWILLVVKTLIAAVVYTAILFMLEIKAYHRMAKEMKNVLPQPFAKLLARIIKEDPS